MTQFSFNSVILAKPIKKFILRKGKLSYNEKIYVLLNHYSPDFATLMLYVLALAVVDSPSILK